jgi:hypothetical protein
MPYGFYQLVRLISFVGFGFLAFASNKNNNAFEVFIFISLSLLFQPFLKISLGRTIWNIVDITVAVYLIANLIFDIINNKHNK